MTIRQRFSTIKKLLGIGILVVGLVIGLDLTKKVSNLLSEATGKKAEIVVDINKGLYSMPRSFRNIAQGGEENDGMLTEAVDLVSELSPNYIRLDHIYDFYEVVKKENGQLSFDFSKLDKEVEAILQTGAKPLLALSYMPPGFGSGIVDPPDDWNDWQVLVRKTVEHYSGRKNKNISNVYYEVWNEPDLFGEFKTYGKKNYLEMYRRAAWGADEANDVQPFKLGGPATTGWYKNWMKALLELAREENVRLDFISWHRYSFRVEDFRDDVDRLNKLAKDYPEIALKEKLITEWGFDSDNHSGYDTQFGAAHMLAVTIEMLSGVHKAFVFEVKDGKDPGGKAFWGRYGLLTHEDSGLQKKPRFEMMKWLNDLGEKRITLTGEGSFVRGVAAYDNNNIQVYLVNYDVNNHHYETVPVVIKNLESGNYQVVKEVFQGSITQSQVSISEGIWSGQVIMSPNQVVRLTLNPT